jgi:hypothetical protein
MGHLAGPYTPADVDQIAAGMESLRGQTLGMLATYIQKNLTVPAITQLLQGLVQQDRLNALGLLRNMGCLAGPYSPADVDQIVVGMESLRSQMLAILSTHLKDNLSLSEVAMLLNGITGQDRVNTLALLSNTRRLTRPFTLSEIDAVTGIAAPSTSAPGGVTPWMTTSQQPPTSLPGRTSMGPALAVSASGLDFGDVLLGNVSEEDIFFRSDGLAIASATCSISPPFSLPSGCSVSVQPGIVQRIPVRFSPTQPGRAAGTLTVTVTAPSRATITIPVSANAVAGRSVPAASSGPAVPSSTAATPAAIAAMNARIAHLRRLVSQQQPYLYGSTGPWDAVSIVARDLPVRLLGFTDYRVLYDQMYFAAVQYSALANRRISQATRAAQSGDLAAAGALLDRALSLLTQRDASYSGAVAAANHDLERARTYVKATYEASKWAAGAVAVGIPGASCMVDAAGSFIDFALNAQEGGLASASKQFASDQIADLIVNRLPIPGLDGRTLADAMENRAGKLLSTAGVIDGLKTSLSDPTARKVVIDAAKSLVALPAENRTEAVISAQLDRILEADSASF